jgi:voltage-gated sodium channel
MITVIRQKKQREKELKRALAIKRRQSEAARHSAIGNLNVTPISTDGFKPLDGDGLNKPIRNILPFQSRIRRWYISDKIQISVAVLIFLNFLVSIIRAQVPDGDAPPEDDFNDNPLKVKIFFVLEFLFNSVFAVELVINMYGHWFKPFWESPWNVFDFVVVATSLTSIFVDGIPGFSVLRLFRAFRVFRLFRRIPALKKITSGVVASLTGVSSAVFLLSLVMGIWSIMGVSFFREEFPVEYGSFFKAMLTNFQITTYDSWASSVARPIINHMGGGFVIYFITYVFVSSIIISNVIVAILLDKYLSNMDDEDEDDLEIDENGAEVLCLPSTPNMSQAVGVGGSVVATQMTGKPLLANGGMCNCPCCGYQFQAVAAGTPTPALQDTGSWAMPVGNTGMKALPDAIVPEKQMRPTVQSTNAVPEKQMRQSVQSANSQIRPSLPQSNTVEPAEDLDNLQDSAKQAEEEPKELTAEIIEESGARMALALDRVEALVTPNNRKSRKLLQSMKEDVVSKTIMARFRRHRTHPARDKFKMLLSSFYHHNTTQIAIACLIFANFFVSAVEAQSLPLTEEEEYIFAQLELAFNMVFLVELLMNMYAHWFLPFWSNSWNWFDFIVVFISLIAMIGDGLPGFTVLRLFRAFRVFRLFKRIPSLRKIVVGVVSAMPGVANAFVLLGLVMGIWSIMGVNFFGDDFPMEFGTFFKAMLTCFQIMTFDGWASEIARPIMLQMGGGFALYFISYVFVASIIMSNVIVAILLDKYLAVTGDATVKLDDNFESLELLESSLILRLQEMEKYLKENNLKYCFNTMNPLERTLALRNGQLDGNATL